jgi:N-terminal domain of galactosyltransferase
VLSTIVTWRDRVELPRVLPALLELTDLVGGDVTVVDFGGAPGRLAALARPWRERINVVRVEGQRYFNKSCAQNVGVASSSQPILFFCDCDIVVDARSVATLVRRVADRPGCFGTLAGVRESTLNSRNGSHVTCFGYELLIRTTDGRELRIVDQEEDARDGTRHAPGLLVVRRSDLLSIGGYNSRLHGWGWEDQDMIGRLTLGAGLTRLAEGSAIHLSHDDAARVGAYPDADRWASRDHMFRQALANYDKADFEGTYDSDVRALVLSAAAPADGA